MNRQMIAMVAAGTCLAGTLFAGDGGGAVPEPAEIPLTEASAEVNNALLGESAQAVLRADVPVTLKAAWLNGKTQRLVLRGSGPVTLGTGSVAAASSLTLNIREHISNNGFANKDGLAVAEMQLLLGGNRLDWPTGHSATQTKGGCQNGADVSKLTNGATDDKWFQSYGTEMEAVIRAPAGTLFYFDAYDFCVSDRGGRFPNKANLTWTAPEVSGAGTSELSNLSAEFARWGDEPSRGKWMSKLYAGEANPPPERPIPFAVKGNVFYTGATLEAEGTLCASETPVADNIVFAEGSTFVPSKPLIAYGTLSGTVTVDLAALTVPAEGLELFRTAASGKMDGLTVTVPDGCHTRRGTNSLWLMKNVAFPLKAEVAADAAWSTLTWTDANGAPFAGDWSLLSEQASAELTLTGPATVTVDGAVTPTLTVNGAGGAPELAFASSAVSTRKVRLQLLERVADNNGGCALSEFELLLGGRRLDLSGTVKSQGQTGNVFNGVGALTDGYYCGQTYPDGRNTTNTAKWFWNCGNGTDLGNSIWFVFDAGEGKTLIFDSYALVSADVTYRNPRKWTVDIWDESSRGWKRLHDVSMQDAEAKDGWTPNTAKTYGGLAGSLPFSALTVRGVTLAPVTFPGTLTLGEGTVLKTAPDARIRCRSAAGAATADVSALPENDVSVILEAADGTLPELTLQPGTPGRIYGRDGRCFYSPFEQDFAAEASGTAVWSGLGWNFSGIPWGSLGEDAKAVLTLTGDTELTADCRMSFGTLNIAGPAEKPAALSVKAAPQVTARKVRLTLNRRIRSSAPNDGCALAEFRLTENGTPLTWNDAFVTMPNAEPRPSGESPLTDGHFCSEKEYCDTTKWYLPMGNDGPFELTDCRFVFDAGEGKTFTFDGYGLSAADVPERRNPTSWDLEVWDDTLQCWQPADSVRMTDAEALEWTQDAWIDRAVPGLIRIGTARLSHVAVSAFGLADEVVFGEGCTLKAMPGGGVVCKQASGAVTVDVSALTDADYPCCILRAPQSEALTLNLLPGQTGIIRYDRGAYWVLPFEPVLTATLSGEATLETLTWTLADGTSVGAGQLTPSLLAEAEVTLEGSGTLRLDAPAAVRTLTVAGRVKLSGAGSLAYAGSLTVNPGASLTAERSQLALSDRMVLNGTLMYTSDRDCYVAVRKGSGKLCLSGKEGKEGVRWTVSGAYEPGIECRKGHLPVGSGYAKFLRDVTLMASTLRLEGPGVSVELAQDAVLRLQRGSELYSTTGNVDAWRTVSGGRIEIMGIPGAPTVFSGAHFGNSYRVRSPISGVGPMLLRKTQGNAWGIDAPIADGESGAVSVMTAKGCDNVTLSGNNTFTGGLTVTAGSVLTLWKGMSAGLGDVTVEDGAELKLNDASVPVKVLSGKTLRLAGKLTGSVELHAGAAADASAGTVTGDVVLAEDVTSRTPVTLKLPEGAGIGLTVLTCANAAALDPRCFAAENLPVGMHLACNDGGTALVLAEGEAVPEPEPEFALPEGFDTLPEAAVAELKALLGAVSVPEGAPAPTKVSQIVADAGSDATPETLANALAVFTGIASAAADPKDASAAVVTVSYMFGVTGMRMASLDGGRCPVLVAAVQTRKDGAAVPAGFAEGTQVLGVSVTPDGSEARGLLGTELKAEERAAVFGPNAPTDGRVYLKLPPVVGDSAFFRVRAVRP